jgi:capsular polysaccharide biosynthesis protein
MHQATTRAGATGDDAGPREPEDRQPAAGQRPGRGRSRGAAEPRPAERGQEADPTVTMSAASRGLDETAREDEAGAGGGSNLPARRDGVGATAGERPAGAAGGFSPIIRLGLSAVRGTRGTMAALRQAFAEARTELGREEAPAPPRRVVEAPPTKKPRPITEAGNGAAPTPGAADRADEDERAVEPPIPLQARARARPERAEALDRPRTQRPTPPPRPAEGAPPPEQPSAPPPRRIAIWEVVALLILPVAVAALGAFATASLSDPVYAARSEIVFDLRRLDWSGAERYLETQKVVVGGPTLLAPIASSFEVPLRDLERDLRVEKVGESGVLRLEYRHPDPTLAQALIKTVTDRYLVILREFERLEGTGHRLLTPAYVLEQPVAPQPLRAAAIGAVIGLALAALGVVLRSQGWPAR